jgi:hypothetical protein
VVPSAINYLDHKGPEQETRLENERLSYQHMRMDAAIGFRAKTGRAIAVVIAMDADEPSFVWRGEVRLVDPSATIGPYHEVMDLPWSDALEAVQPLVRAIEAIAQDVLDDLVGEMKHLHIRGVGVIGSRPRAIDRIGNPHIRAHAAEGILFRQVLETAAARRELSCCGLSEDEVEDALLASTRRKAAQTKPALAAIGRVAGRPWRADERLAASAAWVALARGSVPRNDRV